MAADADAHGDRRQRRIFSVRPSTPGSDVYRRQIIHDIEHELSTITLLAAAVSSAPDVGRESRARVQQIVEEVRWLGALVHIYQDEANTRSNGPGVAATRLDLLAREILRPLRLSSRAHIALDARAVSARLDRLAFWRALSNVVWNALTAAGDDGNVVVRVRSAQGTAVVEVEDDGPGFGSEHATHSSLGLDIVAAFAAAYSGQLTFHRGRSGGCVVRLELPEAV